ncbi:MAG: hypothetical protein MJH11_12470, partial [Lentisphaeria bacterium]|nr:hypothetical protein [Lentisphaeria bacterium]
YFAEKVDDLHIIMGVDSLLDLHKWVKSDELCSDHKFIFFKRPGYAISEEFKKNYNSEIADKLLSSILSAEELEISSSQIRLQIKSGQQANGLDPLVYDYIIKNNLYQEEK